MAAVVWSAAAIRDLERIEEYIATHSPAAAIRTIERIQAATTQLELFPRSGRMVENDTYRELIVGAFIIEYFLEGDLATIITVRHGAKTTPDAVHESEERYVP